MKPKKTKKRPLKKVVQKRIEKLPREITIQGTHFYCDDRIAVLKKEYKVTIEGLYNLGSDVKYTLKLDFK